MEINYDNYVVLDKAALETQLELYQIRYDANPTFTLLGRIEVLKEIIKMSKPLNELII